MFWSQFILAKQGPLGTIWIAAHSVNASKLRKSQIAETDLAETCDTIIHQTFNHQKVPLALRLSGQLLLGVVRIYTRKLDFLQRDSAEALVKFRQAFQPGAGVDLPPDALTAPLASIVQPDKDFESLDFLTDPAGASHRLHLDPLASRGTLDMGDPFMGDFATNYGEDEFEYGVLPDEMDLEPETFRAAPAQALAGRRSSGPGTLLEEFDALPMPMPLDDDDAFAPLPDDDDAAMAGGGATRGGGASLAGSLDLDGQGPSLPGDSPGAAPREGGAPTPGSGPGGAGPSSQPGGGVAGQRAGDDGERGARKRKFKLDSAVVLTNAEIRNALKDVSDITKPRGGSSGLAALTAAHADAGAAASDGVDSLVEAPAIVAPGAAAKLRRLFVVPTAASMMAAATAAAAAAVAAAAQRSQHLAGQQQHAAGDEAGPATAPVGAAFDDDDMPAPMADDDLAFFPAPVGGFEDDAFAGGALGGGGHHLVGASSPHQGSAPSRGGSIRRLSSALDVADEDGAAVPSGDAAGPAGAAGGEPAAGHERAGEHQHWSKRTRHVLGFLQRSFAALEAEQQGGADGGGQGREPATPEGHPAQGPVLQLEPLLQGQSKTHAARLFFELLVLSKDGLIGLEQRSPYGDVSIARGAGLVM